MRATCLDCVTKHLGSAAVFVKETEMGYPNYYGYVLGELDHAADEAYSAHPKLAMTIREHRLAWTKDRKHLIPFEDMFAYIAVLNEAGTDVKLPDELYRGLERNKDGSVAFSADTRPKDARAPKAANAPATGGRWIRKSPAEE